MFLMTRCEGSGLDDASSLGSFETSVYMGLEDFVLRFVIALITVKIYLKFFEYRIKAKIYIIVRTTTSAHNPTRSKY